MSAEYGFNSSLKVENESLYVLKQKTLMNLFIHCALVAPVVPHRLF